MPIDEYGLVVVAEVTGFDLREDESHTLEHTICR